MMGYHELFYDILDERLRQEKLAEQGRFKFTAANPALLNTERLPMLIEEIGEVARQVQQQPDSGLMPVTYAGNFDTYAASGGRSGKAMAMALEDDAGTVHGLRKELVQTAAICVAWIEALDSKDGATTHSPRESPSAALEAERSEARRVEITRHREAGANGAAAGHDSPVPPVGEVPSTD
jgi:hypothetical protein